MDRKPEVNYKRWYYVTNMNQSFFLGINGEWHYILGLAVIFILFIERFVPLGTSCRFYEFYAAFLSNAEVEIGFSSNFGVTTFEFVNEPRLGYSIPWITWELTEAILP